jgi:hypothetical protein
MSQVRILSPRPNYLGSVPDAWEERHRLFNIINSIIDAVKPVIGSELPRIEMLEFLSKLQKPRDSPAVR